MTLLHRLALITTVQLLEPRTSASAALESSYAVIVVGSGQHASAQLRHAGREVRRYLFAATGALPLLEQVPCQALEAVAARTAVFLVSADCAATAVASAVDKSSALQQQLLTVAALRGEEHLLLLQNVSLTDVGGETPRDDESLGDPRVAPAVLLGGGSPRGVLHGAYFYAEHGLGIHFGIGGDSVPQQQSVVDLVKRLRAAPTNVVQSPVFATRGLNPFHDFAVCFLLC